MRMVVQSMLVWVVLGFWVSNAYAQYHPNKSYEYRWMKGRFVPPYTSFPSKRERGSWQCYSKGIDINCSYVEEQDLRKYEYIFRRKR